jgi:hypothetical protein
LPNAKFLSGASRGKAHCLTGRFHARHAERPAGDVKPGVLENPGVRIPLNSLLH